MPMYRTPPSTPPSSPPPSRSPSASRSRTYSKRSSKTNSRSRSSSQSSARSHASRASTTTPSKESVIKTSLVFLGSVAAATFAAHKFWPKGITYGDKEEWECEEHAHRKVKKDLREERARARKEVPDRRGEYAYGTREERRARYREGATGRPGGGRGDSTYVAREEVYERVVPARGASRERGMSRDRGPEREREREWDRYSQSSGSGSGRGRASSRDRSAELQIERQTVRREARYYPPAPQRYMLEPAPPPAPRRQSMDRSQQRRPWEEDPPLREKEPVYVSRGPPPEPRSRRASLERGPPPRTYEDEPEVVYVSRAAPEPRSRRVSVDPGSRRRYEDDEYRR
ncbi:hypothetical protein GQ53DRAFT_759274 [Thozetella sp. PMI_491]|nr:hypothetical protein GQ53DRAFT_759274 [Thozetella sp. PMI_491]